MKYILHFIALLFISSHSFCQNIQRQENETAEVFINKVIPDSAVLAHQIISTNIWTKKSKSFIAFYEDKRKKTNSHCNEIIGHLYFSLDNRNYKDLIITSVEEDGGCVEIVAVFFANADKDKEKELVVLCKYEQRHYDYNGAFYETLILDDPVNDDELTYLEDTSKRFFGCECSWREGKTEIAKYKNCERD
jgi:hypothetical protein